MVNSRSRDQGFENLERAYSSPLTKGSLNDDFRTEFKKFAVEKDLSFEEDCIGNIYITRPGLDSSVSSIAISFNLDSASNTIFHSAFSTFQHLKSVQCTTDVTLLGFTSLSSNPNIGREVWEGDHLLSDDDYSSCPELKEFSQCQQPESLAFAARLEIEETKDEEVIVKGSPLLTDQARTAINAKVRVEDGGPVSKRCVVASVRGKEAVDVASAIVVAYGAYVKKLFDNFD